MPFSLVRPSSSLRHRMEDYTYYTLAVRTGAQTACIMQPYLRATHGSTMSHAAGANSPAPAQCGRKRGTPSARRTKSSRHSTAMPAASDSVHACARLNGLRGSSSTRRKAGKLTRK